MGGRGKGCKPGGPSDAAFQALMGAHGGHPMAAGMAAAAAMGGMLPAHMAGPPGLPGRDFIHPMQLQQVTAPPPLGWQQLPGRDTIVDTAADQGGLPGFGECQCMLVAVRMQVGMRRLLRGFVVMQQLL